MLDGCEKPGEKRARTRAPPSMPSSLTNERISPDAGLYMGALAGLLNL